MQNSIVVHVCQMNFFYVFIVPGPILRHFGEFGKFRLLPGENTRFLPGRGQFGYLASTGIYRKTPLLVPGVHTFSKADFLRINLTET